MRDLELQARMKTALKQGGHVFAHRGAGKTRTIVELMKEDNAFVVVVHNQNACENIKLMMKAAGFSLDQIESKVFNAFASIDPDPHTPHKRIPKYKKILVDEWAINPYRGGYYAAISSLPNGSVIFGI